MKGEMKVSDVRNWLLINQYNQGDKPSKQEVFLAEVLEKRYSTGLPGWTNRSLSGAWITTGEVEKLFTTFFEDGAWRFRAMQCDVTTYIKDNPAIEPSIF